MAAEPPMHDPGEPEFPGEREWLLLPPPEVQPEFVDRTLARLRDARLLRPASDDGAAGPPLPPELLAAHATPPPRRDFVARALERAQRDRAADLRRLLLRYETALPTADFVDRTLRALRADAPRRRFVFPWRGLGVPLLAAAALLFLLRPQPDPDALRPFARAAAPALAVAYGPTVLGRLLAARAPADALPPVDAAWLLFGEGRR
jgi:hypothetical protein